MLPHSISLTETDRTIYNHSTVTNVIAGCNHGGWFSGRYISSFRRDRSWSSPHPKRNVFVFTNLRRLDFPSEEPMKYARFLYVSAITALCLAGCSQNQLISTAQLSTATAQKTIDQWIK